MSRAKFSAARRYTLSMKRYRHSKGIELASGGFSLVWTCSKHSSRDQVGFLSAAMRLWWMMLMTSSSKVAWYQGWFCSWRLDPLSISSILRFLELEKGDGRVMGGVERILIVGEVDGDGP